MRGLRACASFLRWIGGRDDIIAVNYNDDDNKSALGSLSVKPNLGVWGTWDLLIQILDRLHNEFSVPGPGVTLRQHVTAVKIEEFDKFGFQL